MFVDHFHIVSLFLSNPCTPSTLSKEAFVYFVCPTEIPQPPSRGSITSDCIKARVVLGCASRVFGVLVSKGLGCRGSSNHSFSFFLSWVVKTTILYFQVFQENNRPRW